MSSASCCRSSTGPPQSHSPRRRVRPPHTRPCPPAPPAPPPSPPALTPSLTHPAPRRTRRLTSQEMLEQLQTLQSTVEARGGKPCEVPSALSGTGSALGGIL